jgi:DNA-binding transcriptional LysR family regulator
MALTLAKELHFSRAAAKLYVSQPALSASVKSLERELGIQLFNRNTRQVELTAAGRVFIEGARDLVTHADRLVASARNSSREVSGLLRVAYAPSFNVAWMCSLISAINRNAKSPVRVAPVSAEPAGFGELLAKQGVQAVFSTGKIPDPRFSSETLFREEFVAVFYRNHPLADADLSYAGLSGEPVIFDFEPWLHANFLNACAARGYQPVIRQEVNTFQECLHFVHESMGITFLPASIRLECRDDAIVSAILPGGGLYIEPSLLYREDSPSAGLDYFARFMRKYVIEQGPLYSLDSLVTR